MSNALEILTDKLEERVLQLREWVGGGQAKDYAEYLKTCGEIKGLLLARQNILDLKQKMEHSDDE